nr:uncharacterized protein LOC111416074 [Onthophagus taurus]
MSFNKVDVYIYLKRFDFSENPTAEFKRIQLNKDLEYTKLKQELENLLEIDLSEKKVIKIRNKDGVLIPLGDLQKGNDFDNPFYVEILNIHHTVPLAKNNANLLQDAYLDAIRQKIKSMESRVSQAELLIPQLQWRRQAHMDETVNTLSNRVAFLNRRIDELTPVEWKSKIPETIS